MHILSSETIHDVDSMLDAYITDHWEPASIESQKARDRLVVIGKDLNLLDMPVTPSRVASLPGRDEAMLVVLSDLALKASDIMKSVDRDEMINTRGLDDSVALNPIEFDLSREEKEKDALYKSRSDAQDIEMRGAPTPSFIDRGPVTDLTATRIVGIADDLIERDKWSAKKDPHGLQDTRTMVDRFERLHRNGASVVDPEVKAAYDLMRNDIALKIAQNVMVAQIKGAVKDKSIDPRDATLLRDPHARPRARGLSMQAGAIEGAAAAISKGPSEAELPVMARTGAER